MIPEPRGPTCLDAIVDDQAGNDPDHPTFVMRLCNFATGGAGLLVPSHHVAVRDRLLPAIRSCESCSIDVLGYASRFKYSQNPSANLTLSRARSAAVVNYLRTILSAMDLKFRFNVVDGCGDSESYRDSNPDLGFRRAALIRFFCQGKPADSASPELHDDFANDVTDQFGIQAMESFFVPGRLFETTDNFFSIQALRNGSFRHVPYQSIGLTAALKRLPAVMASKAHVERGISNSFASSSHPEH